MAAHLSSSLEPPIRYCKGTSCSSEFDQRSVVLYVFPALIFTAAVFIAPLASVIGQSFWNGEFTFSSYYNVVGSSLFQKVLVNTVVISFSSTIVALLFAYPIAYHMAKQDLAAGPF